MARNEASPPLEQMLDLVIESTSVALLPLNLGAWAALAWIRWLDAAGRGRDAAHRSTKRAKPRRLRPALV